MRKPPIDWVERAVDKARRSGIQFGFAAGVFATTTFWVLFIPFVQNRP